MIRVLSHTRRRPSATTCCRCRAPIEVGDVYLELVATQETDIFERAFVRRLAHECCVSGEPAWSVTTPAELHRRAVESLEFVRNRYGIDVRPGARCLALGEPGEVVEGDGKYVCVRVDGRRHPANYHANDIVLCADNPSPHGGP